MRTREEIEEELKSLCGKSESIHTVNSYELGVIREVILDIRDILQEQSKPNNGVGAGRETRVVYQNIDGGYGGGGTGKAPAVNYGGGGVGIGTTKSMQVVSRTKLESDIEKLAGDSIIDIAQQVKKEAGDASTTADGEIIRLVPTKPYRTLIIGKQEVWVTDEQLKWLYSRIKELGIVKWYD